MLKKKKIIITALSLTTAAIILGTTTGILLKNKNSNPEKNQEKYKKELQTQFENSGNQDEFGNFNIALLEKYPKYSNISYYQKLNSNILSVSLKLNKLFELNSSLSKEDKNDILNNVLERYSKILDIKDKKFDSFSNDLDDLSSKISGINIEFINNLRNLKNALLHFDATGIEKIKKNIILQYKVLENENQYSDLNDKIIDFLGLLNNSIILNEKVSKDKVRNNFEINELQTFLSNLINNDNFTYEDITTESINKIKKLNELLTEFVKYQEKNDQYREMLENSLSKFKNAKTIDLKNKILEEYSNTKITNFDAFNNNIFKFIFKFDNYFLIEKIQPKDGVIISFNKENDLIEIENDINSVLNSDPLDLSKFNEELENKVTELSVIVKNRNDYVELQNSKMDDYINSIEDYHFKNPTIKEIYLSNKTSAYDNLEFKENLVNKLLENDININIIESINEHYQLNGFTNYQGDFNSSINSLKEDINSRKTYELIEKIKDYINKNNITSNENNFENNKQFLINAINTNNKISDEIKNKLLSKTNKSLTNIEINTINDELEKYENNFYDNINLLIEKIQTFNIINNIKEDIIFRTKLIKTVSEFTLKENNLEKLNNLINKLNDKIVGFETKIQNNQISGKKEFDFYIFKNKHRKFFTNILKQYDFSDININFNKLNNMITELEQIESENDDNTKTASQLLEEQTVSTFNLENYSKESKYNLDSLKSSGSFTLENAPLFFDHFDNDKFNYRIKDLKVSGDNLEILTVVIEAKIKGVNNFSITFEKSKTYQEGIKDELDAITFDNLDSLFDINYDLLNSYTLEEFNNLNDEQKNNIFKKSKFELNNFFKYKISNITIENNTLKGNVDVLYNNQILKSVNLTAINKFIPRTTTKEEYWDQNNKNKILEIINSNNIEKLFTNITLKDPSNRWNHTDFLASQAKEKFDEFYNLPKFGKYQIYIDSVENINDFGRRADLKLWYTKDGIEEPKPENGINNKFTINNFMFLNYEDIKPKGDYFTSSDFNDPKYTQISDDNILNLINKMNESVIHWRLAQGHVNFGPGTITNYRALNPINFMEQKAFNKFNYFFKISNTFWNNNQGRHTIDSAGPIYDELDFIPLNDKDKINKEDVTRFDSDINPLVNNYFYYFYDFKLVNRRGLKFKIGWIKKDNTNIRFTNEKEYELINLVNDYEQAIYPEIMVNNITLDDLVFNKEILKSNSAEYFKNHKEDLRNSFTIKNQESDGYIYYNNFRIKASDIKISDVQKLENNQLYIKLKVTSKNILNNSNKDINGKSWYRITGFNDSIETDDEQINTPQFENTSLSTIYISHDKIKRKRQIEPLWRDLLWKEDKNENNAYWYLDKKYIEKTLLRENTSNAKLIFTIYAGLLSNDKEKNSRVWGDRGWFTDDTYTYTVDWNKLKENKIIKIEKTEPHYTKINNQNYVYDIFFIWEEDKGIKVVIQTKDRNQKVVVGSPEDYKFEQNQLFDPNHAIVVMPSAAKVSIEYTNNLQDELFNINSNRFDYNDVFYTDNNQPILFSNDTKFLDESEYWPNQNVWYKFHDGYQTNVDTLNWNKHDEWKQAKETWMRSVQFIGPGYWGSTSIIGKVNNDPNDYRYYLITNRHVIGGSRIKNFSDINQDNTKYEANFNLLLAPKHRKNDINDYYHVLYSHMDKNNIPTTVIWSGVEQINNTDLNEKITVDLTVFIGDFSDAYKKAKREGNMNIIYKLDYINNKMNNVKFDIHPLIARSNKVFSNQNTTILGFPGGNMSGIINRRPNYFNGDGKYWNKKIDFVNIKLDGDYKAPVYLGAGGSGTSMYLDDNNYIATWSQGYKGVESSGPAFANKDFNFIGMNFNGENPFNLNNSNSFASQIIRENLKHPYKFNSPWFFKNDYNEEDDE
ncbi:MGA_1079 family surface serine endopeptidase [Mycoplasma sp. CSL7503-lung]|uniref:MGA_1079 family surface serine endopeptidase n=1 Tax=Mycoplasma sp. CSL7503-lung TaxID=536372 RepID=UPI0021D139DA|nr:hypothetical protein [Mycoplasma sp. CSL7503-lung]MCU4706932.1 hypothetical protein [Mycoplasma sp. CSL7503-lung]